MKGQKGKSSYKEVKSKVMAKAPERMTMPFTKLGETVGAAGREGTGSGNQEFIFGYVEFGVPI